MLSAHVDIVMTTNAAQAVSSHFKFFSNKTLCFSPLQLFYLDRFHIQPNSRSATFQTLNLIPDDSSLSELVTVPLCR